MESKYQGVLAWCRKKEWRNKRNSLVGTAHPTRFGVQLFYFWII